MLLDLYLWFMMIIGSYNFGRYLGLGYIKLYEWLKNK